MHAKMPGPKPVQAAERIAIRYNMPIARPGGRKLAMPNVIAIASASVTMASESPVVAWIEADCIVGAWPGLILKRTRVPGAAQAETERKCPLLHRNKAAATSIK